MASPKTLALHAGCPKPTKEFIHVSTVVKVGEKGQKFKHRAQGTRTFGDNAEKRKRKDLEALFTKAQLFELKAKRRQEQRAKSGGAFGKPQ